MGGHRGKAIADIFAQDGEDRFRQLDKKVRGHRIRWVLLTDVGRTAIRDDVPEEVVKDGISGIMTV